MAEPAIPLPIEDPRKELERIERNLRYLKARRESLIGRLPAEGVHIPEEEQAIRESQLDELSTVENEIDVLSNKKLEIGQAIGFTEEGVLKPPAGAKRPKPWSPPTAEQQLDQEEQVVRGLSTEIRGKYPELDKDEALKLAFEQYKAAFPEAVEPSGELALIKDAPPVSVDWKTATILDEKTGQRRKMTEDELDEYSWGRQILFKPEQTRVYQAKRRPAEDAQRKQKEKVKALEAKIRQYDWSLSVPPPELKAEIRREQERLRDLDKELKTQPAVHDIGSLEKGGVVVESPMQHRLRQLTSLASRATVKIIRDVSTETKDPSKPAEEFGVFETLPTAPDMIRPYETGGMTDQEARYAAVATMPMFMELTNHFPYQQSTPFKIQAFGWTAFGADVLMPVGPEAVGIALAPFSGGTSLAVMGGAKGAKALAKTAKAGMKITKAKKIPLRKTVKELVESLPQQTLEEGFLPLRKIHTKVPDITPQHLDTAISGFDIVDRAGKVMLTSGMSEANKYAVKAWMNGVTVWNANKILSKMDTAKPISYSEAFKPYSVPDTIRGKAGQAIADVIAPATEAQTRTLQAIRNRVVSEELGIVDDVARPAMLDELYEARDLLPWSTPRHPYLKIIDEVIDDAQTLERSAFQNAKYRKDKAKAFTDATADALKGIDDPAIIGAMVLGDDIAKLYVKTSSILDETGFIDDFAGFATKQYHGRIWASGEAGRGIYADMFKRHLFVRQMAKHPALREQLSESLRRKTRAGQAWAKIEEPLLRWREMVDISNQKIYRDWLTFRSAANDTIRTSVDNSLYSRAPNNSVFFARNLLVDERLARNPKFKAEIETRKTNGVYSKIDAVVEEGDRILTRFDDPILGEGDWVAKMEVPDYMQRSSINDEIADIIITEIGVDNVRRSVYWKEILDRVVFNKGITGRDFRLVDDLINSHYAKQVAEEWLAEGKIGAKAVEAPILSERAFTYATGTERQRRAFTIAPKEWVRRAGFETEIVTKTGLAKAQKGILARMAISKPVMTATTPVALQKAVKEVADIGGAVYNEVLNAIKVDSKAGIKADDIITRQISASVKEVVEEQIKTLGHQWQRHGLGARAWPADIRRVFEVDPNLRGLFDAIEIQVLWKAGLTPAEFTHAVRTVLTVKAQREFVDGFLQDFFSFVEKEQLQGRTDLFKRVVDEWEPYIEKTVKEAERLGLEGDEFHNFVTLNVNDLQNAVDNVRDMLPSLKGRGLGKQDAWFGLTKPKYTDAISEAALARVVEMKSVTRSQEVIRKTLDRNPAVKIDLIQTPSSVVASNFKREPYGFATASTVLAHWERNTRLITQRERHEMMKTKSFEAAEREFKKAYDAAYKMFEDTGYMGSLLERMLTEVVVKGMSGVDDVVNDVIRNSPYFNRHIEKASDHLQVAYKTVVKQKTMKEIEELAGLKDAFAGPALVKALEDFETSVATAVLKRKAAIDAERAANKKIMVDLKATQQKDMVSKLEDARLRGDWTKKKEGTRLTPEYRKARDLIREEHANERTMAKEFNKKSIETLTKEENEIFEQFKVNERKRLGIKPKFTREELKAVRENVREVKRQWTLPEQEVNVQKKMGESVIEKVTHPAGRSVPPSGRPITSYWEINPVIELKNNFLARLRDRGFNIWEEGKAQGKLLDELNVLTSKEWDATVMYGRDFSETWTKARRNLSVPSVRKALDKYSARDKAGVGEWFRRNIEWWRGIQTSGLLGGWGTLRYAGLNFWSAPALWMMTRGVAGMVEDIGTNIWWKMAGRGKKGTDTMFTDVKGKPWSYDEMAKLEQENPLAASAAAAEMDTSNLAFLMEVLEQEQKGRGRWIKGWSPHTARNNVARFGDFTDQQLRKMVFRNGIRRGLTVPQAAREAKDSLFDYEMARSKELNRKIGQVLIFWSFPAESFRAMMDAFARGDAKYILHTYRVIKSQTTDEEMAAIGYGPDTSRIYRKLNKSFEGQRGISAGFPAPMLESFSMAADGMQMVLSPMLEDVPITMSLKRQRDILMWRGPFRPFWKLAIDIVKSEDMGQKEGWYVPNPYVAGVPDWAWPQFKDTFNIIAVKPEERRENKATRDGEHWRFRDATSQSTFFAFQTAAFAFGMRRSIEDNLLKAGAEFYEEDVGFQPYPYGEKGSLYDVLMYQSALKTHLTYREPARELEYRRRAVQKELKTRR